MVFNSTVIRYLNVGGEQLFPIHHCLILSSSFIFMDISMHSKSFIAKNFFMNSTVFWPIEKDLFFGCFYVLICVWRDNKAPLNISSSSKAHSSPSHGLLEENYARTTHRGGIKARNKCLKEKLFWFLPRWGVIRNTKKRIWFLAFFLDATFSILPNM